MAKHILILPGDGIGPEIITEARKTLEVLVAQGSELSFSEALIGGSAFESTGTPLPEATLTEAKQADAVLLGAVGGPQWEPLPIHLRPEKGLLGLRAELGLFANLRPAVLAPQLAVASTLKPEVVAGLDIMIVRELTGGIYFGQPRGIRIRDDGQREGFNTLVYAEHEIERIVRTACDVARQRDGRVCSVDKANVLECTALWREVTTRIVHDEYPDITLTHLYVDNAAMQLVKAPKQFDVIVTSNLFGDILSDCAAMLTGSIGMLGSASLNAAGQGMYEPIHGSAPDIAGRGIANPLATLLSVAMMLRYSLAEPQTAQRIEAAVGNVLDAGLRTPDIMSPGMTKISCQAMGSAVAQHLRRNAP